MQKSADAFRTISEVADDLSLPQHVLRFWETRFPQIRPLKRAGGRRYYRPGDVLLLRTIRQLLYADGYTIKGVQRLLKEQGAKGLGHGLAGNALAPDASASPDMHLVVLESAESLEEPADDDAPEDPVAASDSRYRDLIAEALATIDECGRILDAVLRPVR